MASAPPLRVAQLGLPDAFPGDVVQVALNAILGSMKGKQLIEALDTLDRAIMCRVPQAVSPAAVNVVHIRARFTAAHEAAVWYQQASREAEQLSAIAAQLREMVVVKGRRK